MSPGYTILATGALMLLMSASINGNRLIVNADAEPAESQVYKQSVAFAEELLGEIRSKSRKFDHADKDSTVLIPANFTPLSLLGPDVGSERDSCLLPDTSYKSMRWYNDIDDYNNYVRIVRIPGLPEYRDSVWVYYVSETDFKTQSSTPTYLKKIVIKVVNMSNSFSTTYSAIRTYYQQ